MLLLTQNKQSDYRIVLSAAADEDTKKMAQELADYLERITGCLLPIASDSEPEREEEILLGATCRKESNVDLSEHKEETYLYKVDGKKLVLTGAGARGVFYSVYAFLEEICGVRYWTPDYESVPACDELSLPEDLSRISSPGFSFRDLNGAGSSDPKWMVKMRINGQQSLGSERYHKTPFVGGGVGYAGWFVHTIAQLAEMEKGPRGYWDIQPCLMDEGVYQTVLKNVRKWLEASPDAELVSISQNDGDKNSMCQCEKCRAFVAEHGGAESALWINFVSRIAEELGDEYPRVNFDTLSYTFSRQAPTGLTIPNNVVVRVAPLRACFRHGVMSCQNDQGLAEEMRKNLSDWSALLTDNLHVWEYDAFFSEYWSPNVNFSHLRENLRIYSELGVTGMFVQGDDTGSGGFSELRAYLSAKLIWNPKMGDEEFFTHLRQFCEGYYGTGTAAPLMRYMELVDEKTSETHYTIYAHAAKDYLPADVIEDENGNKKLDMTFLRKLQACFDEAEAQGQDEEQLLHLKKARIQIRYYELVCYHYMEETFGTQEYVPARNELGAALFADAQKLGIIQVMEGYWLSKTTTETWRHPLTWWKKTS